MIFFGTVKPKAFVRSVFLRLDHFGVVGGYLGFGRSLSLWRGLISVIRRRGCRLGSHGDLFLDSGQNHIAFGQRLGRVGEQAAEPCDHRLQLMAMHHHIDHAVVAEILSALETFGQLLTDGLFDHPLASKANERARFCQLNIAKHGIGCGNAAVVGSVRTTT